MLKKVYAQSMELASSIVVKREDIARREESADSFRRFERYEALTRGDSLIDYFREYDFDLILEVVNDRNKAARAVKDRKVLTTVEEQKVIEKHVIRYRDEYVEKNNYYRELMGLPRLGSPGLKLPTNFGDPLLTPFIGRRIHELEPWVLDHLWNTGMMNIIIRDNPKATWLKFTGARSIPFYTARKAKHLDIIYYNASNIPKSLEERFLREYYIQRNFHMRTLYDDELLMMKSKYSGFIGILILIATIRAIFINDLAELNLEEAYLDQILKSYDLYD